jgi:hypothetical protein
MYRLGLTVIVSLALLFSAPVADPPPQPKPIAEATAGARKIPGFLPLWWDARSGKLALEMSAWDTEFLYATGLASGVGSNDLGLDRGQPGQSRVVVFQRHGPKVLLIQRNYAFRASGGPEERRAVRESFAESVLAGFIVVAEEPGGAVLVDATDFFLRDAHDVAGTLRRAGAGAFHVDSSRSAVLGESIRNFPDNTEVETLLTFTGDPAGPLLGRVAPSPDAITVRVHHSLVRLPDDQYRPRAFDPRCGYFAVDYLDFSAPLGEPLKKAWIVRHRLRKKDPLAKVGEPVRPIVYCVDRGAPEPIRTALVEGARWWDQAFEAAGYKAAFRVELMPEGADPLDVRYNVLQWVHRATRGWAYGLALSDPRTGEILKGHVIMDSQRARHVFRLAEALLASYEDGKPANPEIERIVLARIRQLSAHEVGHTLGLAHNFAASAAGRASVMDYPHPLVRLKEDGGLDVSDAYATGVGAWDKVAIAYGYEDFPPDTAEKEALAGILERARAAGLVYITDEDARPAGGAHPRAHLWDNGPDAVEELGRVLQVRAKALERFSEKNLPIGRPLSALEDRLVLLYLFHRYQVEATAKVLGGLDYTYALRGDGNPPPAAVAPAEQRRGLTALLGTLQPDVLALPERVLRLLPPPAYGHGRTPEDFHSRTGPAFDALAGPEAAANLTVGLLLEPARAARLAEQHSRDDRQPGLAAVIDQLLGSTWRGKHEAGYRGEVQRVVERVILYHLMALAAEERAAGQARAIALEKIAELEDWLQKQAVAPADVGRRAHYGFALSRIRQFHRDPARPSLAPPASPPPGQPIGAGGQGCGRNESGL